MKKISVFLLAATLFISCDSQKKDKPAAPDPKQMEDALKETTTVEIIDSAYTFKPVTDGEKVAYSYRFKNTGSKPLVIIDASASCGCTVPQKPEQPILPGEMGFIKIVFDSKGRVGNAYKTVTVKSNAVPEFPTLILTGDVIAKD